MRYMNIQATARPSTDFSVPVFRFLVCFPIKNYGAYFVDILRKFMICVV